MSYSRLHFISFCFHMHGLILKTSICYWQDQPDIPLRLEIIIFLFISSQERTNLPPIIRFPFIRLLVISFLRYLIAKQIAILDRITHSLAHLCAWNLMASPSYCPRVLSLNRPPDTDDKWSVKFNQSITIFLEACRPSF